MAEGRILLEGAKDDTAKIRFELVPPDVLRELAVLYTIGARKYEARNWEKGIKYSRVAAAHDRHWNAYLLGEERDLEGQRHLTSAAWNLVTLLAYDIRGMNVEWNDLPIFTVRNLTQLTQEGQNT